MKGRHSSIRELVSFQRLSCSTICFRSYPLEDALFAIRRIGFERVDLGTIPGFCPHFDFQLASEEEERVFIETVRESGLAVNTFTTLVGQANDPEQDVEAILTAGLRNLKVARKLDAVGVVFNCGLYRDRAVHPFEQDLEALAGVLAKFANAAAELGVRAMVEAPHKGLFLRTPEEARMLMEAVGSGGLELILDINHYHAAGWTPQAAVDFIGADSIGIVHLRDAVGRQNRNPIGAGEIDFRGLLVGLSAGGYRGNCSFEFSDTTGSIEGDEAWVRTSVAFLHSLVAS